MTSVRGLVRRPSGSEALRILLTAGESDGALGVVEIEMDPGTQGPPLHLHPTHGEGFYVLAGTPSLQIGDSILVADVGTWAFAPRDTPHTLANFGSDPARLLCVFAPGGFERRFERILAELAGTAGPVEPAPPEQATRMLGPPLSADHGTRPDGPA